MFNQIPPSYSSSSQRISSSSSHTAHNTEGNNPLEGKHWYRHVTPLAQGEKITQLSAAELTRELRMLRSRMDAIETLPENTTEIGVDRLNATHYIRRRISENKTFNRDIFAIHANDNLQGMLVMRNPNTAHDGYLEIESLLTFPNTKGYGVALMDVAINYSQRHGYGGNVCAEAIESARPFYERIGGVLSGSYYFITPSQYPIYNADQNGILQIYNKPPRIPSLS